MSDKLAQPSDRELLATWRGGDSVAGNLLFERHHRSLLRFFANKVGPDCEDLVQATLLACVEGIERFRGEASFRTLLFAIAWNKLCEHQRKRGRAHAPRDPLDEPAHTSAPSFGTVLVVEQERASLRAAMRRLPLDTQAMLELHYWEAMPIKQIASVLDRSVGSVKTRMRRGRMQLERECGVRRRTPSSVAIAPIGSGGS